ncbi:hypothetical protein O6P43_016890, partial [Quillaja saponaria]
MESLVKPWEEAEKGALRHRQPCRNGSNAISITSRDSSESLSQEE